MTEETVRLNLGCGQTKEEGWIGVDIVDLPGVDIVHDLETYPWPFPDDYSDQIVMLHFWEHIKDIIPFMNELYRIMKPGSTCMILSPYYTSIRAWQDPTHVREVSEAAFLYYNKDWREKEKLDHMDITCDFDYSYGYFYTEEWQNRSAEAKEFAAKHYLNVVDDIQVLLIKKVIEEE